MSNATGTWILGLVLAAVSSLVLGLTLVWINIERVDMAYGLQKLQKEYDRQAAHSAKLEVERDNLMSPYRLRKIAEALGMRPANPGQMRHLEQ